MSAIAVDTIDTQRSPDFHIGDVVALRGGGPRMTVTYQGPVAFAAGNWLVCQWFDEHGELRQDMFSADMLRAEPRSIPAASVQWGVSTRFMAR